MSLGPPTLGWRQGLSIDLFPFILMRTIFKRTRRTIDTALGINLYNFSQFFKSPLKLIYFLNINVAI